MTICLANNPPNPNNDTFCGGVDVRLRIIQEAPNHSNSTEFCCKVERSVPVSSVEFVFIFILLNIFFTL